MEVIQTEPLVPLLINRWFDDTMNCRLVITARQVFCRIAAIDDLRRRSLTERLRLCAMTHEGIFDVSDVAPLTVPVFDLQGGDRLAPYCRKARVIYNKHHVRCG
jgi:hypothetical protein